MKITQIIRGGVKIFASFSKHAALKLFVCVFFSCTGHMAYSFICTLTTSKYNEILVYDEPA